MESTLQSASIQLTKVGTQDQALYANPEASLFANSFKRITPFAVAPSSIIFAEAFEFGKVLTVDIPFHGDMLNELRVYVRLPALPIAPGSTFTSWTQTSGIAMIEWCEFLAGNVRIDRRMSEFVEIEDTLTTPSNHVVANDKMVGRMTQTSSLTNPSFNTDFQEYYIALPFYFTKSLEASLPLFLIDKSKISLRMKIRPFLDLVTYDGPVPPIACKPDNGFLLANYILLDKDEKAQWKSRPYEFTFEQWQDQCCLDVAPNCTSVKMDLSFINCVKDIVWVLRETASVENNDWFNYASRSDATGSELMTAAALIFEGKYRFAKMPESYYRLVTTTQHRTFAGDRNIYTISFANKPELAQNTGTADFSRYDNIQLQIDLIPNCPSLTIFAFAKSYNKIIISNGILRTQYIV